MTVRTCMLVSLPAWPSWPITAPFPNTEARRCTRSSLIRTVRGVSCLPARAVARCHRGGAGKGNTVPCRFDGTVQGLPHGIDDVITTDLPELGVPPEPTALRALAIAIPARRAAAEPAVAGGDASAGRRAGLSAPDRAGPPELEGTLSAHPDPRLLHCRRLECRHDGPNRAA